MLNRPTPKQLFLADGLGAIVSAFMLGIVLVTFQEYIGTPVETLLLLASIPCVFVVYDLLCYFFIKKKQQQFLLIIALANAAYCLLSIYYLFLHRNTLSILGWIYFILEILILIVMITIEFNASKKDAHPTPD